MKKPKPKSKRKSPMTRRQSARMIPAVAPVKPPRSDRHQLVALALSSLVCGLLVVINADRVTHARAVLATGESRHGWPWVYLTRNLIEVPAIYLPRQVYSWPYPPARNEVRDWSWVNLGWNAAVVMTISVVSYFLISAIVFRYDRWRHPR